MGRGWRRVGSGRRSRAWSDDGRWALAARWVRRTTAALKGRGWAAGALSGAVIFSPCAPRAQLPRSSTPRITLWKSANRSTTAVVLPAPRTRSSRGPSSARSRRGTRRRPRAPRRAPSPPSSPSAPATTLAPRGRPRRRVRPRAEVPPHDPGPDVPRIRRLASSTCSAPSNSKSDTLVPVPPFRFVMTNGNRHPSPGMSTITARVRPLRPCTSPGQRTAPRSSERPLTGGSPATERAGRARDGDKRAWDRAGDDGHAWSWMRPGIRLDPSAAEDGKAPSDVVQQRSYRRTHEKALGDAECEHANEEGDERIGP